MRSRTSLSRGLPDGSSETRNDFQMFLTVFTLAHVAVSLTSVASGLTVTYGLLSRKRVDELTAIFFFVTAATNLIGFGFSSAGLTRPQFAAIFSLCF
jgi:hypothetical protein